MTKMRVLLLMLVIVILSAFSALAGMQSNLPSWEPITEERLLKPRPGDWLSYRRTVDVNGFSPLIANKPVERQQSAFCLELSGTR